mgnify:CR=1 FL=1
MTLRERGGEVPESKKWSDALDKKAKALGLEIKPMGKRWTSDTINDEFFDQLAAGAYVVLPGFCRHALGSTMC